MNNPFDYFNERGKRQMLGGGDYDYRDINDRPAADERTAETDALL